MRKLIVVEDDLDDFLLLEQALRKAGISNSIFHLKNGDEALAYFTNETESPNIWEEAYPPIMILIDLHLVGKDGWYFLSELKSQAVTRAIPLIVLSGVKDEREVNLCYQKGANAFLCKQTDFEGFCKAIQKLKAFWWDTAVLPYCEDINRK
ncbi:MAG: response regulator [Bacteroidota bacterium]